MNWLLSLLAGLATGVLSGFGVGGGTLLLLYMTGFAHLEQDLAQGINLLYFLPTAAAAPTTGKAANTADAPKIANFFILFLLSAKQNYFVFVSIYDLCNSYFT